MLNRLYFALRQLRSELDAFADTVDGDYGLQEPNTAMRLATEIDVALGLSTYFLPSADVAYLDGLLTEALDFLNHELEVAHGYRTRGN